MVEFLEKIKDLSFLEIIGSLSLIFGFIHVLFKVIPQLRNFKNSSINYFAEKFKNKKLQKKAIANNIEKVVNDIVIDVRKELPIGWLKKVSIKWISGNKLIKSEENLLILKLKPLQNQDYNLINGVFHCFNNSLFPDTIDVIPKNIHKASVMLLSKRALITHFPFLKDQFETNIVETAIKSDPTIAEFYGKFDEIDKEGYFTGTFIREVHHIAKCARYNEKRKQIEMEIRELLSHIIIFQNKKPNSNEDVWFRKGLISNYGFILVAKPFHSKVDVYVSRALKRAQKGIYRLYVLGCNQERFFFKKVIKAISTIPEYKLIELYKLNRDYRGEKGGVGALLIIEDSDENAEREIDKFFDEEIN
jgi:hypothetical protein